MALQGNRRFCYFMFQNAFQVTVSWQERWRLPNDTHAQLSPGSQKKYCRLISFGKHCASCEAPVQTAWARAEQPGCLTNIALKRGIPGQTCSTKSNPQLRLPLRRAPEQVEEGLCPSCAARSPSPLSPCNEPWVAAVDAWKDACYSCLLETCFSK